VYADVGVALSVMRKLRERGIITVGDLRASSSSMLVQMRDVLLPDECVALYALRRRVLWSGLPLDSLVAATSPPRSVALFCTQNNVRYLSDLLRVHTVAANRAKDTVVFKAEVIKNASRDMKAQLIAFRDTIYPPPPADL
jgi:hypothetical protein